MFDKSPIVVNHTHTFVRGQPCPCGAVQTQPMNLVVLDKCPACGESAETAWLKACSRACVRSNAVGFTDNGTMGSPHAESHLHLTCHECEFTWLAPVDNAEGVEGAW